MDPVEGRAFSGQRCVYSPTSCTFETKGTFAERDRIPSDRFADVE